MAPSRSNDGHPRMPQMPSVRPVELSTVTGRRRGRFLVPLFALLAILFLLGAISVVSIGFTIVLAGILGFVTFHYLVWGWWLSKIIIDEDESPNE
jgi:hypothetical protein